ncbi:MAG: Crp/Fnr family transcriptional regulator [Bacteroidota bacterium]
MYYKQLKEHFLKKNAGLTRGEVDTLSHYYTEKYIAKGEHLLRGGEICEIEGYVGKGCFKVYVIDEKGEEKVLYFAAPDWWVVDIDSFENQGPSELYIQALEDSVLLIISRKDKERLYEEMPKVERLFRIMYQKAIVAWQKRLIRNHSISAEDRYHHFIKTYPEIAEQITNKLIASYLGITQEFVSVIRKRRLEKNI